jgi:putative peptidoglycan lipid II flippase
MGIFAIAIGTVLLPLLSKIDFNNNKIEFINHVRKGQRLVLLIGLPSCIGIFFCSEAIIAAIFYRGEFAYIDVIKTSLSLKVLALGLPFFMLMKILIPSFFSRKLTRAPVLVAAISLILNIFLNYVFAFIYGYGHIGIAIGSAIAALISVLILEFILIKDGVVKLTNPLNRFNLTLLLSCLVLSAYLIWFNQYFSFQEMSAAHRIMILSAEVISAILLYFISIKVFLGNKLRQLIS